MRENKIESIKKSILNALKRTNAHTHTWNGVSRSKCRFKSIFKVYVLKKIAYGADADAAAVRLYVCDIKYMENRYI